MSYKLKAIAIMQPTFLPWLGYFAMLKCVDEFVFLDTVQFDTRSWQQRNRICHNEGSLMLTVPVKKNGLRGQSIHEVRISEEWKKNKIIKSITHSYSRYEWFEHYHESLFNLINHSRVSLCELNISIIEWGCDLLEIKTPTIRSSSLQSHRKKDQGLLDICRQRKAETYISPIGSHAYLKNSNAFKDVNINLKYFLFSCAPYKQPSKNFIPQLSFIDALFLHGPKVTNHLLNNFLLQDDPNQLAE